MKIWQKFFLIFLIFLYLVGIISVLWMPLSGVVSEVLGGINQTWRLSPYSFVNGYFIFLFILSLIFLLIFLFYPITRTDFVLEKDKGSLTLTNRGLTGFVENKLSSEGLENVKLSIKNYQHRKKISIVAETPYKKEKIHDLPKIKTSLEQDLLELLTVDQNQAFKIKINLRLNQLSSKKESARVI